MYTIHDQYFKTLFFRKMFKSFSFLAICAVTVVNSKVF